MKERMARFMAGRNGNDQLNLFLLVVDVILLLLAGIFANSIGRFIYPFVFLLLIYIYFRMFSRNVYKRREENGKFIRQKLKVTGFIHMRHERWIQRHDYKFFTCPSCKTTLRVPRGHGKIKIVCRKCGTSFEGKT